MFWADMLSNIAKLGQQAPKVKRHEWEWGVGVRDNMPNVDIDLEEIAAIYDNEYEKENNKSLQLFSEPEKPQGTRWDIVVYVEWDKFISIEWLSSYKIVNLIEQRHMISAVGVQEWDSFVWDKRLVKATKDLDNVDKMWLEETIMSITENSINGIDKKVFLENFNPLTYKRCQQNIDLEDLEID